MNATTSAAAYGPLAGADLEVELAQARVTDGDARDARPPTTIRRLSNRPIILKRY